MSKLIVYTQEGKIKSIGTNPKCTDKEINDVAKKLVPEGIDYEIKTVEEFEAIPEVVSERNTQKLLVAKIKKKEEVRQAYINSQIQTQLDAVDNATTEEELNNI